MIPWRSGCPRRSRRGIGVRASPGSETRSADPPYGECVYGVGEYMLRFRVCVMVMVMVRFRVEV